MTEISTMMEPGKIESAETDVKDPLAIDELDIGIKNGGTLPQNVCDMNEAKEIVLVDKSKEECEKLSDNINEDELLKSDEEMKSPQCVSPKRDLFNKVASPEHAVSVNLVAEHKLKEEPKAELKVEVKSPTPPLSDKKPNLELISQTKSEILAEVNLFSQSLNENKSSLVQTQKSFKEPKAEEKLTSLPGRIDKLNMEPDVEIVSVTEPIKEIEQIKKEKIPIMDQLASKIQTVVTKTEFLMEMAQAHVKPEMKEKSTDTPAIDGEVKNSASIEVQVSLSKCSRLEKPSEQRITVKTPAEVKFSLENAAKTKSIPEERQTTSAPIQNKETKTEVGCSKTPEKMDVCDEQNQMYKSNIENPVENGKMGRDNNSDVSKNGNGAKNDEGNVSEMVNGELKEDSKKRPIESEEAQCPTKKLCQEIEKKFPQHDKTLHEFIQNVTKNNIDEIQRHADQLLTEINTLREMAQKKEYEWNNILHLKKVKEEILLRLLRQRQVLAFENSHENGVENESENFTIDKSDEISGVALKQPTPAVSKPPAIVNSVYTTPVLPDYNEKPVYMQPYQRPQMQQGPKLPAYPDFNGQIMGAYNNMGRQGPVKDVKSIIADYRQRHPEQVPRRGRRLRSILNPQIVMNPPRAGAPKFGNLLDKLNPSQRLMFNECLVKFADLQKKYINMSINRTDGQTGKQNDKDKSVPPPPYPEISLHPVTSSSSDQQSSLLHGILTKPTRGAKPSQLTTLSPTLAKLLSSSSKEHRQHSNDAIAAYVQAKNCGEITITPVQSSSSSSSKQESHAKPTEEVVQLDDEDSNQSECDGEISSGESDRKLVIDEGMSSANSEVPLCQGCRRKDAQFVCAGCANQWYCSRDCQVAAWDEHSDICSG